MEHKSIRYQLRRTAAFGSMISLILTIVILLIAAMLFMQLYRAVLESEISKVLMAQGIEKDGLVSELMQTLAGNELISGMNPRSVIPLIGVVLVFPLVMGFTSWTVSSRMTRKIARPLNELRTAANHVAHGDLDYQIHYDEINEFGTVCEAFNDMQVHLKASIEENVLQEQSRRELFAGISHDLRTPLTAIRGYVKGIQDGVANTPEKQAKYMDTILTKTHEMEKLVERLFLYSKLDIGSESFVFAPVAADAYLEGFIEVVRTDMAQKGLSLAFNPGADVGAEIKVDCDQMYRVFTNILDNSAKYKTSDSGKVTVSTQLSEDMYIVTFADDGPGVPDATLSRLFDTFYRADPARTATSRGSGLGLSIARKIVSAHGGHISAANGDGLIVTIALPFVKGDTV